MQPNGDKVCHIVKNNIQVANSMYNCLRWAFQPLRIAGLTIQYNGFSYELNDVPGYAQAFEITIPDV
jgi:hypothetical protein